MVILASAVLAIQFLVFNSLGSAEKFHGVNQSVIDDSADWNRCWEKFQRASSETELEELVKLLKQILDENVRFNQGDSRISTVNSMLAQVYMKQGRFDLAESVFKTVLRADRAALGHVHPVIGADLRNIALAQIKQKHYKDAEKTVLEAIALDEKALGDEDSSVAVDFSYLALIYGLSGDLVRADGALSKALAINRKSFGENDPVVAANLVSLALLNCKRGTYDEVNQKLEKAIDIFGRCQRLDDSKSFPPLESAAILNRDYVDTFLSGNPDHSVEFPDKAYETSRDLRMAVKPNDAERVLLESLDKARKASPGQERLGKYLVRLNNVLFDQGKDGQAIFYGEIACRIFDSQPESAQADLSAWNAGIHSYLAMSYERRHQFTLAEKHYQRALEYARQASSRGKVNGAWIKLIIRGLTNSREKGMPG
ncbi:MAG: tetratricopeptide repeat protein [Cyanobacteriota/Melainabacteria group bacterium]